MIYSRRQFLKISGFALGGLVIYSSLPIALWLRNISTTKSVEATPSGYQPDKHLWAMAIDIERCIGCRRCLSACQEENHVPEDPLLNRTWLERYALDSNKELRVEFISQTGLYTGQGEAEPDKGFFVPKLCNQCANPPCVAICPVNATFRTADGVILVDRERCIGCKYCLVACPYGARYLNPETKSADKCTFCYHRITRGLVPACVQACPTSARSFGDLKNSDDPVTRRLLNEAFQIIKPTLGTSPMVYYKGLRDGVR